MFGRIVKLAQNPPAAMKTAHAFAGCGRTITANDERVLRRLCASATWSLLILSPSAAHNRRCPVGCRQI
jgi:hypothetical protein